MSRAPDHLPNGRRLGPARVARQPVNSAAPSRLSCAGAGTGLGRFSWAVWQKVSQDKGRASWRTSKPERRKTWQKEGKALEGNNHQRCKKSRRTVRCWNQDRCSPCCINTRCPEYSEYSSSSRTSSTPKHLDFCTITPPGPDVGCDPEWAGPL